MRVRRGRVVASREGEGPDLALCPRTVPGLQSDYRRGPTPTEKEAKSRARYPNPPPITRWRRR